MSEQGEKSFFDKAKEVANDLAEKAGGLAVKVTEKIPDPVKDTAGDIKDKTVDLFESAKDKLGVGQDKAKDAADSVTDAVPDALPDSAPDVTP